MHLSLWRTQEVEYPTPPLKVALRVRAHIVSGLDVLPEMAKHLSNTASAVANALRASLGLYVRDKGAEDCKLRLAARTLKRERMVRSRFDVSRHDFVRREPPSALITAESPGAAVEFWLGLIIVSRARA